MKMDRAAEATIMEVEQFSKLGALKLKHNLPQKALKAYRHAYQSALLLGQNGYMQRACAFNLAAINISIGSYSDGLIYLKQAEPPEGCHDGRSNGDLYFNYGLAFDGLRNTSEVKNYYIKALKEYQSEQDNVKMEAEMISRLRKVYVVSGEYYKAESYVRQLIQTYTKHGNLTGKLQSQVQQASLLIKMDNVQGSETIADNCLMTCQGQGQSEKIANILIDLSLVFTQICKYNKALQCCHSALNIFSGQGSSLKQAAVLYQNLGVIHNYLKQYKDALEYHQTAANKFAEMKNRKSQCHCLINLGYAYSQMQDIDQAGQQYLYSLHAAKECGDKKSEWQSLEALGSVEFHRGNLKRSQDYYKSALTVLAKSQDADDTNDHNRILEKLTKVIELQVHKPEIKLDMTKQEEMKSKATNLDSTHEKLLENARRQDGSTHEKLLENARRQDGSTHEKLLENARRQDGSTHEKLLENARRPDCSTHEKLLEKAIRPDGSTHEKLLEKAIRQDGSTHEKLLEKARRQDGSIITVRKDGQVKYLNVRRSGTLQKFNKVALGLDVSMSPLPIQRSTRQANFNFDPGDDDDIFSACTTDFSDLDEEKDKTNAADREIDNRRLKEKVGKVDKDMDSEDVDSDNVDSEDVDSDNVDEASSEEDEKKQVRDAMQKVFSQENEIQMSSKTHVTSSSHNVDREADASRNLAISDETEKKKKKQGSMFNNRDKHLAPPPIPKMLTDSTYLGPMRTYEVPVKSQVQANDHRTSADHIQVMIRNKHNTAGHTDDGNNFFHSEQRKVNNTEAMNNSIEDDDDDEVDENEEENRNGESNVTDPIYESIKISTLQKHEVSEDQDSRQAQDNDAVHSQLPKGKRDKIEFQAFQADMKAKRANETKSEIDNTSVKKSTKVCIVM